MEWHSVCVYSVFHVIPIPFVTSPPLPKSSRKKLNLFNHKLSFSSPCFCYFNFFFFHNNDVCTVRFNSAAVTSVVVAVAAAAASGVTISYGCLYSLGCWFVWVPAAFHIFFLRYCFICASTSLPLAFSYSLLFSPFLFHFYSIRVHHEKHKNEI